MSAKITEIIAEQSFEILTKEVGAILLLELDNQLNLEVCSSSIDLGVFIERIEPVDKSEDVVVNVSLNNVNYDNHNEFTSQGSHTFNIDVYCFGEASTDETANDNVRFKLQKITGWIRYILSSTKYKTLGLAPGFIGGTYLQSINFYDSFGKEDGAMTRMSTIVFSVRANEFQNSDDVKEFTGNDTTIKLGLTDKGYKLIFNT
jgi:hypothetical protein